MQTRPPLSVRPEAAVEAQRTLARPAAPADFKRPLAVTPPLAVAAPARPFLINAARRDGLLMSGTTARNPPPP